MKVYTRFCRRDTEILPKETEELIAVESEVVSCIMVTPSCLQINEQPVNSNLAWATIGLNRCHLIICFAPNLWMDACGWLCGRCVGTKHKSNTLKKKKREKKGKIYAKKTANKCKSSFLALTFLGGKNEDEKHKQCLAEFRGALRAPRSFHQQEKNQRDIILG